MMWRTRFVAVLAVGLLALFFSAAAAYAGWSWNAIVAVEDTKIRTSWSVTDDANGASDYTAGIVVALPEGTDARVIKSAPTETVEIVNSSALTCTRSGIESKVTYTVNPRHRRADGENVSVTVSTIRGKVLGEGEGQLNSPIPVDVVIPGSCDDDDDDGKGKGNAGDDDDDDDDDDDERRGRRR